MPHNTVMIKPHNKKTKRYFSLEKARLLRNIKSFQVHHIGSTSVKGLGGKNTVDMLLLAKNKNKARSTIKK